MGNQIKDKCVIISTLTCMHSRAVLLEKELMIPLLQTIRKVHLSSVNKGKLPLKLQLFRWLYRTNSILRLSPAAGVPKEHQNIMKGSFRQEEPFPPYPCGGSSIAQTWDTAPGVSELLPSWFTQNYSTVQVSGSTRLWWSITTPLELECCYSFIWEKKEHPNICLVQRAHSILSIRGHVKVINAWESCFLVGIKTTLKRVHSLHVWAPGMGSVWITYPWLCTRGVGKKAPTSFQLSHGSKHNWVFGFWLCFMCSGFMEKSLGPQFCRTQSTRPVIFFLFPYRKRNRSC